MIADPSSAPVAELKAKQGLMLFPTPMFTGILPDIAVCDRIETKVRELQKSGVGQFSTVGTSTRYLTPDNLHTLPETKDLVDIILLESGRILDAFSIKRESHYITGMWANVTHPNHSQHMHVHTNCVLSGLVYIKAPQNCGPTMFSSPRRFTKNFEPAYTQRNELNSDFFVVAAEKARMLMWPSHVPHMVERGTADESEDRITVAFNIMIRGNIDLFTSRLVLI